MHLTAAGGTAVGVHVVSWACHPLCRRRHDKEKIVTADECHPRHRHGTAHRDKKLAMRHEPCWLASVNPNICRARLAVPDQAGGYRPAERGGTVVRLRLCVRTFAREFRFTASASASRRWRHARWRGVQCALTRATVQRGRGVLAPSNGRDGSVAPASRAASRHRRGRPWMKTSSK